MKNLLIASLLLFPLALFAQTTNTINERYCDVQVTGRLFSKKLSMKIDYGTDSLSMALKPANEDEKLKTFTNIADFLNYMKAQGWQLVTTASTVVNGSSDGIFLFFKKEI